VPPVYHQEAARRGLSVHEVLEEEAARLSPGESGLLALDWWNGNRSVLVDTELGGLLIGMTLATRAPEIYRALIEATAFGTRVIVDAFEENGVRVDAIVACGGLPERNHLLMQIYADVTGREFTVAASRQAGALGAAMHAAVAAGAEAGGHATIVDAARVMVAPARETYRPIDAHHAVYDELYREYVRLHDLFGRGGNDVMKTLRRLQQRTAEAAPAD
jgi:L-ribulokinase